MPSLFARFIETLLGPSGPTPSPDDRITESGYQFAETAGAPVEPEPAFVSLATYADRTRPDLTPADYLGTRTSCDAHRWIGHGQCPNCRVEAERLATQPTSVLDLIPPTEPKPGHIRRADPLIESVPVQDHDWVKNRWLDEAKRRAADPSGEYTATAHRPAHGGYPDTTPRPVPERSPSVDAVLEQARHANGRRITGMVIDEEVPDPDAGEQQGMYHAGVQKAVQQRLATVPCWCGNAITKHEWQAGVHLSRNNCPHTYRGAPLLGRDPWQLCAKATGDWQCSRDRNHVGPCAAYPSPQVTVGKSPQVTVGKSPNDARAKALRAILDDTAQLLEKWAAGGEPPSPTNLRRLAKAMRYASIPNESP